MEYPKMIIFDIGSTLLYTSKYDSEKGLLALIQNSFCNNPDIPISKIAKLHDSMLETLKRNSKPCGVEIKYQTFIKAFLEFMKIEISFPLYKAEEIFWSNSQTRNPLPNIHNLLNYLSEKGISTAIISNSILSEHYLGKLLSEKFPNHRFSFIISSCEYIYRKPSSVLFNIAISKSNLNPSQIWYCGDNITKDVHGASKAGIFPILYTCGNELSGIKRTNPKDQTVECKHLHITDWNQLIRKLELINP